MKLRHLLLSIVLLTVAFSVNAQDTTKTDGNSKREAFAQFADKHLRLSGYLQGGFSWEEQSDPSTTFYLRRARVSLSGDFAKEKFDYRLQVDMAGTPKICDLYVRYKPFNALNVQLGQFKLPFSLENELYGPTKFEFIEYSYLTTYIARNDNRFDGISATGRDIGLQLYGGFIEREGYNIINYNIGVFNGSGINGKDNNSSKDFIARLIVKPVKGLSISGSYMYAETKYGDNLYMKSPRWSVGAIYDVRHLIIRTEYAAAKFGEQDVDAFYALAGWHFERPWSVVARYEFLNDNIDINPNQDRITLGAIYKPFKFLRLQFNMSYTMYDEIKIAEIATPKNSLGTNLMVSLIF